jgi:hypothetical protein
LKIEKEYQNLKENLLKNEKEYKLNTEKIHKAKINSEKIANDFRIELGKYKNKINSLQVEKKSFEEKYSKMAENYQKFFTKLNQNNTNINILKPANIEFSNFNKKNDICKILGKVNGTEKLIQTIKGGYNESLRELLLEISAMKNFILDLNNEIIKHAEKLDLKGLVKLDNCFINMPFLDSIVKIKYAFRINITKAFDFWNLDNNKDNYNISGKQNYNDEINKGIEFISDINDINNKCSFSKEKNIRNLSNNNNIDNNKRIDSISLIREKCDSIFEEDSELTSKSLKCKDKDSNCVLRNKIEVDTYCDNHKKNNSNKNSLIDFDFDDFNLDDSKIQENNSISNFRKNIFNDYNNNEYDNNNHNNDIGKINIFDKDICKDLFTENDNDYAENDNDIIYGNKNKIGINYNCKNMKNEDISYRDKYKVDFNDEYNDYLADKELEMLKLKWMKNISN